MSIFPAYTNGEEDLSNDGASVGVPAVKSTWLSNSSFPLDNDDIKNLEEIKFIESSLSSSENEIEESNRTLHKEKKHTKKVKRRKRRESREKKSATPVLEFNGNEEYYIDKSKAQQFLSIRTLHKPACPRYRHQFGQIVGSKRRSYLKTDKKVVKRYFQAKFKTADIQKFPHTVSSLEESEYIAQLGQLNRKTLESTCDLQVWINLLLLQDRNPYRWSRLSLAERKLDIVNRALSRFPRNEQLYRQFIDIVNFTYPSFEVTKMLDRLLFKDPYNYTLWTAQIMATQGSMARCIVPDVLHIYERCMSKMHRAQQSSVLSATTISTDSDDIMLRLFNNCALFLRQSGLYEQFIALLKLALELNVSTDQFKAFTPSESDHNALIEFEELVLQSGLPMNEIWLRIEKLRQGFNFLPCPEKMKCNDPQRIVFNEDICHYIYPLKLRDNLFFLILLILRLLKVPFIQCEGMANKFSAHLEQIGESDAIEDILSVFLQRSFAISQELLSEFRTGIYTLAKEMAVSPTFLNNTIGYDIYIRCISNLLLECATTFAHIDERKRETLILLWCRFERLLLVLEQCSSKATNEYIKSGRNRFKNLLKQPLNRNVLIFYTEFAIYEFESLDQPKDMESVGNIFENLIALHSADETQASDLCYTYVTFAEMLIGCGKPSHALKILTSYALRSKSQNDDSVGSGKMLAALKQITVKLEQHIEIEKNVDIMILEQYLLPDYTMSLLKVRVLIQCLIGQKLEAIAYLDKLLNIFRAINIRHTYLREQIMEFYMVVLQMTCPNCHVPSTLISKRAFDALNEFPRNLFLLQHCGMLSSEPWFRIRTAFLRAQPTILSVTFLIILARYRFFQMNTTGLHTDDITEVNKWDKRCNEVIIRNRILNLFKTLSSDHVAQKTTRNALLRNALFWRLYIRFLSDQCTAFETSKKCLLTALDECPWSKALYLDGATYVPQELTHLQDLIIEKQLRIYALPEELEILREQ